MSTQLNSTPNVDEFELERPLLLKLRVLQARQQRFSTVFSTLVQALEAKDYYLYQHSYRVMYFTRQLAQLLNLPPGTVTIIMLGALFHDLGKIGISDTLLHKTSPLTEQELAKVREH